jgi:hypothetical protein
MQTQLHLTKELNQGEAHADVDRLAHYLEATGHLEPGLRDDAQTLGPVLSDALGRFQADHHLAITGIVDEATLHALNTAVRDNSEPDVPADVALAPKFIPDQYGPSYFEAHVGTALKAYALGNGADWGIGVDAYSSDGPGVKAKGEIGVDAESASGPAVRADSFAGTAVEASGGTVGVDAHGGTVGVRAKGPTGVEVEAISPQGIGVKAFGGAVGIDATSWSIGVRAACTGSGTGVYGTSADGVGVIGSATGQFGIGVVANGTFSGVEAGSLNGNGVFARSNGKGAGVRAHSDDGLGGEFSGGKAPIRLAPAATAGAPNAATGSHKRGELSVDANGQLFFCTVDGTPGTWKRVRLDNL